MPARDTIISALRAALPDLRTRFGVSALAIFGSTARDEDRADSDVDILVEFDRPASLFTLAELRRHLATLLGRPVDLGTPASLKPAIRDEVIAESVRVA